MYLSFQVTFAQGFFKAPRLRSMPGGSIRRHAWGIYPRRSARGLYSGAISGDHAWGPRSGASFGGLARGLSGNKRRAHTTGGCFRGIAAQLLS